MKPYQRASFAQRFWAYLIDLCVVCGYSYALFIYLFKGVGKTYLVYIILFLPIVSIFLLLRGQSIGKFIIRIKIVDIITSEKPGLDQLIIRSLIKGYSISNSFLYGKSVPVHEAESDTKVIRLKHKKGIKANHPDDSDFRFNL